MVYLEELLVVMTDRLKIVSIHARNVPRTWTKALIDDDASLPPGKRRCRVLMRRDSIPLKHKKNRLRTTFACPAVASKQGSCRDSMLSSL